MIDRAVPPSPAHPDLDAAAEVMAEATSYFVLPQYGREGLAALIAAGWTLTPPAALDALSPAPPAEPRRNAADEFDAIPRINPVPASPAPPSPEPPKVVDLMAALEESVRAAKAARRPRPEERP